VSVLLKLSILATIAVYKESNKHMILTLVFPER